MLDPDDTRTIWLAVGLLGQVLFASRFLIQWVASERRQQSVIPTSFWYLSIVGSCLLFAYAAYRADPVFLIGQATGLAIYSRNLFLIRSCRVRESESRPRSRVATELSERDPVGLRCPGGSE